MLTVCEVAPDPDPTLNGSGFGLAVKPTPLDVPLTCRVTFKLRWTVGLVSRKKGTVPLYDVFAVTAPVPAPQPTPADTVIVSVLTVAHNQPPPAFVEGVPTVNELACPAGVVLTVTF